MNAIKDAFRVGGSPLDVTQPEHVRMLATAFIAARCLHVAAELDIATRLGEVERSAGELAEVTGCQESAIYRLLRTLASLGIFEERSPGRFGQTPASRHLVDGSPGSLRAWVRTYGDSRSWASWGAFEQSIRTGAPAFEHLHGLQVFDFLAQNPDLAQTFDAAMVENSSLSAAALLDAYDFSRFRVIADIGGGRGLMICAMLARYPHLQGVLFDLPHVQLGAVSSLAAAGYSKRCEFVAGNFFEAVPNGADAYFLQRVLHDWDDAHCIRILRCCAAAMSSSARLIASDAVIAPGNEFHPAKLTDLHMMVMTHGGRERTGEEFSQLLSAAGLRLTRIVATRSPLSLVEAELA
jgi:hypothetical protein